MKIYIAHATDFDYDKGLYQPLRELASITAHELILPHAGDSERDSSETIGRCGLMIAEVSHPSTGVGIEIGRAEAAHIPILCIFRSGAKVSSSLQHVRCDMLDYADAGDLVAKLSAFLASFRPSEAVE